MGTFTLTNRAKSDLKSIAIYTQKRWGKKQREIYTLQFDNTFHILAENPTVGIESNFIKEGYKRFLISSHIIFYRSLSQTKIEIVRILHKRMSARTQIEKDWHSTPTIPAAPSEMCLHRKRRWKSTWLRDTYGLWPSDPASHRTNTLTHIRAWALWIQLRL